MKIMLLDLEISPNDHVNNLKNLGKFLTKKTYAKIGQNWDSDAWTNDLPSTVKVFNAFYQPWLNELVIPAGYLHHFNFDSDQPMYLNFPIAGATVGHEMIHGFDSNGRDHDKNGNFVKTI